MPSKKIPYGCRRIRGIAHTDTLIPEEKAFSRIRCKQWTCTYCSKRNKSQWRAVLTRYTRDNQFNWSFITITLPDYVQSQAFSIERKAELSAEFVRVNWNTFMTAFKREFSAEIRQITGKKLEYVRVLEQHKSGAWHIHLLVNFHIPDSEKRKHRNGTEYYYSRRVHGVLCPVYPKNHVGKKRKSFGYIHDARTLEDNFKSVMYVTKYMTKRDETFQHATSEHKLRVIQTSRSIKFHQDKSPHVWSIKSAVFPDDIRHATWHDINKDKIVTIDDMQPYYPHPEEYEDSE